MRGRAFGYSEEELAWIKARRELPRRLLHMAFCVVFDRYEVTEDAIKALCLRKGWGSGRTGCFPKGSVPPNKGKKCPPGVGGNSPEARRTQFRKGQVSKNFKGHGHEWICSKDGYVLMIVAEKNPWSGNATRPVHKHKYLWEQKNGPVPEGHILKCLDGNKLNTDPSNWEAIHRGVNVWLNHRRNPLNYEAAPPELKPTILAIAKLKHAKGRVLEPA
jgi:hypothetical protein